MDKTIVLTEEEHRFVQSAIWTFANENLFRWKPDAVQCWRNIFIKLVGEMTAKQICDEIEEKFRCHLEMS